MLKAILPIIATCILSLGTFQIDRNTNLTIPDVKGATIVELTQLTTVPESPSPTPTVSHKPTPVKKRVTKSALVKKSTQSTSKPKTVTATLNTPTPQQTVNTTSSTTPDSYVQQLLTTLNNYRIRNGVKPLSLDNNLASYAQSRAAGYLKNGSMDEHAGFNDFINNQNGFAKLGFSLLGENSSEGYKNDAVYLIEQAYGTSPGHNHNQLNPDFTHVGIGVAGSFTDFIFGGQKR